MYGIRINKSEWLTICYDLNDKAYVSTTTTPIFIASTLEECKQIIRNYSQEISLTEIFEFTANTPLQIIDNKREKNIAEIKRLCKEIGINNPILPEN